MKRKKLNSIWCFLLILAAFLTVPALAGDWPSYIHVYRGTTPKLDGVISPGEYEDAAWFGDMKRWMPQFNAVTDDGEFEMEGWVKHDGKNLYFAFSASDDMLYGIDTKRWLPEGEPKAHELTREGFPWFGDGIELLINASNKFSQEDEENCHGDGSSWQMVCNLTKSRLGGVGVGGLMEGEPRSSEKAWNNYQKWILDGSMKVALKIDKASRSYVIEWMIKPNPCLEVKPGVFWTPELGMVKMGLNMAGQDIDDPQAGAGNIFNFNHENWWAGEKKKRTWLKQYGTMFVHPGSRSNLIYVAVDGSDNNTGSSDKPVASLARAKEIARKLQRTDLFEPIEVIV
ncbi:MAG: hypothetical protein ACYST9_03645, partial [Planctomycetota bacterium]